MSQVWFNMFPLWDSVLARKSTVVWREQMCSSAMGILRSRQAVFRTLLKVCCPHACEACHGSPAVAYFLPSLGPAQTAVRQQLDMLWTCDYRMGEAPLSWVVELSMQDALQSCTVTARKLVQWTECRQFLVQASLFCSCLHTPLISICWLATPAIGTLGHCSGATSLGQITLLREASKSKLGTPGTCRNRRASSQNPARITVTNQQGSDHIPHGLEF